MLLGCKYGQDILFRDAAEGCLELKNKLEQNLSHIECGIKKVEVQYMHPPLESLLDLFPQLEQTICVIIGRKDCKSDAAVIAFFTSISE